MKRALGYRLFRAGRFPADVRAALGDMLLVEDGVAMTLRRRVRAPGVLIASLRLEACGLALGRDRVVIAFRRVVVDGRFATSGETAHGRLEIGPKTVEVSLVVAALFPDADGAVRMTCKGTLPPEVRAALPSSAPLVIQASRRLIRMA